MLAKTRNLPGLLLALVWLALALAACGDNTATTAPAATTAATTAPASATTAPAVATTAGATTAASATTAAGTTAAATTTTASATTAASSTTAATGTAGKTSTTVACDKPVAAASNGKTYKIGIAVQNTIPDLQSAIDGTKKGLEQCGFVSGKNVTYLDRNAAGDIPALATIGREFANEKVDAILAVGSQALTNMYNTNKDNGIPVIFNSVTDPYRVLPSVIKSATDHGPITGIQALPPVEDGLKIVLEAMPQAKNIGFIYNPAEVNAVATLDEAQKIAKTLNVNIVTVTVQSSGEVLTAAQSIVDKVDAFLTTTDVTVVNNLESVVKVAIDNKKPLFALNPDSASRGAAVAVGLDYYDNGVSSATFVADVLDGKKPDTLEIKRQPKGPTRVNLKAAEEMGLKIPDSILSRADQKYTEITPPKK
jgi:putative ABC transport system substrate-binding protein